MAKYKLKVYPGAVVPANVAALELDKRELCKELRRRGLKVSEGSVLYADKLVGRLERV